MKVHTTYSELATKFEKLNRMRKTLRTEIHIVSGLNREAS